MYTALSSWAHIKSLKFNNLKPAGRQSFYLDVTNRTPFPPKNLIPVLAECHFAFVVEEDFQLIATSFAHLEAGSSRYSEIGSRIADLWPSHSLQQIFLQQSRPSVLASASTSRVKPSRYRTYPVERPRQGTPSARADPCVQKLGGLRTTSLPLPANDDGR